MYRFCAAYLPLFGHFFGESIETIWVELNQLGAHVKQMNNGHRQDTIIDHHSHWNWKKTAGLSKYFVILSLMLNSVVSTLYQDLNHARLLFIQKREHFKALTELYSPRTIMWNKRSRETKITGSGDIDSVYHYRRSKRMWQL
jgi:hypothetical protein